MAQTQTDKETGRESRGAGSAANVGGKVARETESFAERSAQQARRGGETARTLAETGRKQAGVAAETWRRMFDPLASMQMDMTRWVDDFWRRSTGLSPSSLMAGFAGSPLMNIPACDVRETDEAYRLDVELPGLGREDVDLQVRDNLLILSGQKSEDHDSGGESYRISERRFGRFERSFPIPPDVDAGAIEANFKDGLLKVTLPREKSDAPRGQKISIR